MPNRLICSVLEDMRKANEFRNYSYLGGLIEEAQTLANRMEAALYDQKDLKYLQEEASKLRKQVAELKAEKKQLSGKDTE